MLIAITDCDHPSIDIEMEILSEFGIEVNYFDCKTEEEVISNCKNADGIIVQYAPITRNVLKSLPKCQVVSNYGVGTDNIDIDAATELDIQVCNVPDYGNEEVSNHALALIFDLSRKISYLNIQTKNNIWDFQVARPIKRLSKQTVGIVGLGSIGLSLTHKLKSIGLHVIGYSRSAKKGLDIDMVTFEQLIEQSDIISIHSSLNNETRNLIDKSVLQRMKENVQIINTSRGGIINEDDLLEALKENKIGGVALDVLDKEPPLHNHPLLNFDNVIITPHSAWYSEEALIELKQKAAEEAGNYLLKRKINYPVNPL